MKKVIAKKNGEKILCTENYATMNKATILHYIKENSDNLVQMNDSVTWSGTTLDNIELKSKTMALDEYFYGKNFTF